jgi:pimeloyl-ACP methyl ester carboxylesterase
VVLLIHGFPASSHTFHDLNPLLADRSREVAPDLPGFGNIASPPRGRFDFAIDNLAQEIRGFVGAVGLRRYAMHVFDYVAPTRYRRALLHPGRISAIVSPK